MSILDSFDAVAETEPGLPVTPPLEPLTPIPPRAPRWKMLIAICVMLVLLGVIVSMGFILAGRLLSLRAATTPATPEVEDLLVIVTPVVVEEPEPSRPVVFEPTPAPVLATTLLAIEGPGSYSARLPYKVEYRIALSRGETAESITVTCVGCLWAESPQAFTLRSDAPVQIIEAVVLPGETVNFGLQVAGKDCLSWELQPGAQEKRFSGNCVPLP